MTFAIVLDVIVVALVLYRQRAVRLVRPRLHLRLPVILGVVGLVELASYAGNRHVPAAAVGVLALSFAVGAVVLGAVRALTVRLWRVEGMVLRQGTWWTILLWLASLALHYGAQAWIGALGGPGGIVSASLLLWLGVTYGVQAAVVHRRAGGLLALAGGSIDAQAHVVGGPGAGGWWGVTWVRGGWPGAPNGPGAGGAAGARPAHPQAIEARAEPVPPQEQQPRSGRPGDGPTEAP